MMAVMQKLNKLGAAAFTTLALLSFLAANITEAKIFLDFLFSFLSQTSDGVRFRFFSALILVGLGGPGADAVDAPETMLTLHPCVCPSGGLTDTSKT
jgi:hypothetical protein